MKIYAKISIGILVSKQIIIRTQKSNSNIRELFFKCQSVILESNFEFLIKSL